MQIEDKTGKRKCVGGRDTMKVTLTYTPSDVKKALQRHFKELRQFGLQNKFREADLKEFFAKRVFAWIPEKYVGAFSNWAYDIALKKNYITSNRWDRQKPTIYFINEGILDIRCGPKGPRTARGFAAKERQKQKEQQQNKDEE